GAALRRTRHVLLRRRRGEPLATRPSALVPVQRQGVAVRGRSRQRRVPHHAERQAPLPRARARREPPPRRRRRAADGPGRERLLAIDDEPPQRPEGSPLPVANAPRSAREPCVPPLPCYAPRRFTTDGGGSGWLQFRRRSGRPASLPPNGETRGGSRRCSRGSRSPCSSRTPTGPRSRGSTTATGTT